MKIALAMICKGTDAEAELLERCLFNLLPYVDKMFVTITQPNKQVEAVAKKFNAVISHFEWVNDFAAARNFNFAQVPKEYDYILWTDADDVWRGMENLRPMLKKNPRMDGFGFWYLYDWDEYKLPTVVHKKTMLVKNDGCVTWVGALHEDLQPNRQLDIHFVSNIERLHLSSKERAADNAQRNVTIAKRELEVDDSDPRTWWNLANSQFGTADYTGAKETFTKFIARSESDDERYLAYTRLADVYKALSQNDKAIEQLQLAIGVNPALPDAYLHLAYLYYSFGNMDKAEQYSLQGLVKRPQIHKMIVYNPRDYDYNPMMLLAQVYYQKNRPDLMLPLLKGCAKIYPKDKRLKDLVKSGTAERKAMEKALIAAQKLQTIKDPVKLMAEINKLPEGTRSHPAIVALRNARVIKTESTGRDLVIYCGNTSHQWNPELFKTKGFGGSEEAVVNLAREWASLGWNVTVYNNCGNKELRETIDYVDVTQPHHWGRSTLTYKPFWEWNYRDKQDVVILWRWAKPLDAEINAPKIFLDLHDVVSEGELTPARLQKVTKIFVKTQFHRSLFPNTPDKHFAIVPNGMDFATLESDPPIEKDPYLIINTSSPDRSMDVLPKLFKEVKKRVPQARLQWAYGWDVYKASNQNNTKMLEWMNQTQKEMDEAGIETLGRLSQAEVGKLYQKASYLAYPSTFAEIFCISVLKAQAACCYPVTTDFGAFEEINKYGTKTHSAITKENWNKPYQYFFGIADEDEQQAWVDAMVAALQDHSTVDNSEAQTLIKRYNWSEVAKQWDGIFRT